MATPRYGYNEHAGRYVELSSGRFVAPETVRLALDDALHVASERMANLAEDLRTGRLTTSAWQTVMTSEIKNVQLYAAAAARGGFQHLTQADYGRVGQITREQYVVLRNRAKAIADGTQKLDGTLAARARLYGQAARATYYTFERLEMGSRGFTHERNVLHATESCAECSSETERGLVPLGELIPIGSRLCVANCKCSITYERHA